MTEKYLRITMPNGSKWDVPVKLIAEDRAKYFAIRDTKRNKGPVYDKAFKEQFDNIMADDYAIHDWAANNMDWADVKDVAKKAEFNPLTDKDFQKGWVSGDYEVIEA